ncbi:MAG: hypothetical protein LBO78_02685 [Rickettsiales bacterium]|jgi:hypothetical protein|nr:hypothetical protein [Rickettsiales bacterium]
MKKFIIALSLPALAACAAIEYAPQPPAAKEHLEEIETCEKTYGDYMETHFTNADMRNAAYRLAECYETVAHKVIDRHYSKHAQEMKENLSSYMKASYKISQDAHMSHDYCPGDCGTQVYSFYTTDAAHLIKEAVVEIIRANAGFTASHL